MHDSTRGSLTGVLRSTGLVFGLAMLSMATQAQVIHPASGTSSITVGGSELYYDSGGPSGSYGSAELGTLTICPDAPGAVSVEFTSVSIEAASGNGTNTGICTGCWDQLRIYDGQDATAPPLALGCG